MVKHESEKSRFVMSTEDGKLEVVSVVEGIDVGALGVALPEAAKVMLETLFGDGIIVMKAHRTPDTGFQGDLVIARRNPEALWITGYEDRILFDGRKKGQEKWTPMGKVLASVLGPIMGDMDEDTVSQLTESLS